MSRTCSGTDSSSRCSTVFQSSFRTHSVNTCFRSHPGPQPGVPLPVQCMHEPHGCAIDAYPMRTPTALTPQGSCSARTHTGARHAQPRTARMYHIPSTPLSRTTDSPGPCGESRFAGLIQFAGRALDRANIRLRRTVRTWLSVSRLGAPALPTRSSQETVTREEKETEPAARRERLRASDSDL